MTFWASVLAVMLLSLAGPAAAQTDRPAAPKSNKDAPAAKKDAPAAKKDTPAAKKDTPAAKKDTPAAKKDAPTPPIVFYVARGDDDACGPGCSEWIAADGQFDAGAPQRLRAVLNRLGKRKLPIYFHSPGGNGLAALAVGRMLREREMTAGVSQTLPAGCEGISEQACRTLKQTGQVLLSALRSYSFCASACVYALIGGKVRQVPPGARLGVHAAKLVLYRVGGGKIDFSDRMVASYQKDRLAELNGQMRRYVQEMKVDVRLFDLSIKIPHENVHYLTRDEIVGFGIDGSEFNEARWVATELLPQKLWVMKFFVMAKDERRKELRQNFIRVECGNAQRARLTYFRGLGSDDTGIKRTIEFALGNRKTRLVGTGSVFKLDAIENGASFELWGAEMSLTDVEAGAARDSFEISESYNADVAPRVTRLSTAGLSQAASALRERCSTSTN
jgi:hypothetical protein